MFVTHLDKVYLSSSKNETHTQKKPLPIFDFSIQGMLSFGISHLAVEDWALEISFSLVIKICFWEVMKDMLVHLCVCVCADSEFSLCEETERKTFWQIQLKA